MGIIGILSLIFGILGLLSSPFYIGVIPCIVAVVLGIIGLTDFLSEKWPSVVGLLSSILGIVLFAYILASDLDANRLIIFYAKGDVVYLSNYQDIVDAMDELEEELDQITLSMETLDDRENNINAGFGESAEPADSVPLTAPIDANIEKSVPDSVDVETTVPTNAGEEAADYSMAVSSAVEIPEQQNIDIPIAQTDNNSIEVHITDTGEKYHSAGCKYLRKSDHVVTLERAKASGYEPCSDCNPPN